MSNLWTVVVVAGLQLVPSSHHLSLQRPALVASSESDYCKELAVSLGTRPGIDAMQQITNHNPYGLHVGSGAISSSADAAIAYRIQNLENEGAEVTSSRNGSIVYATYDDTNRAVTVGFGVVLRHCEGRGQYA